MNLLISLIIHKCYGLTRTCIESLLNNTDVEFDLLLIDNGSRDPVIYNYIRELSFKHDNVSYLENSYNVGVAVSWNQTIDFVMNNKDYDLITLPHTDTIWPKNWASKIRKAFEVHPDYSAISAIEINNHDLYPQLKMYYDSLRGIMSTKMARSVEDYDKVQEYTKEIYGDFEQGAEKLQLDFSGITFPGSGYSSATFKREVFEKVGYFDEDFWPGYAMDRQYSDRMNALDIKTMKYGGVFVHHWCSASSIYIDGGSLALDAQTKYINKYGLNGEDKPEISCLRYGCVDNVQGECLTWQAFKESPNTPCNRCKQFRLDDQYVRKVTMV